MTPREVKELTLNEYSAFIRLMNEEARQIEASQKKNGTQNKSTTTTQSFRNTKHR